MQLEIVFCSVTIMNNYYFRWVCEDVQSIKDAMEISGVLSKYDPKSYDSMLELCKTYNKSVDAHLKV